MQIAVPREIKTEEHRVGLTPACVRELCAQGHKLAVQTGAGLGAGFSDGEYREAGADILPDIESVYASAELVVKVKEPQASERALLREGQMLFGFLHLAADKKLAEALMTSGATCVAYETIRDSAGNLPLLTPMSEIAGRLAVQAAARCLEKPQGGRGVLLGGVAGVRPASVLVIGGGVVGLNAARMASGLGAEVTVMDKSLARLRYIDEVFSGRIRTLYANQENLHQLLPDQDAVIGAVLVPGASAPKLLKREHLQDMRMGSVLVDVAIDQGGCFESSRATSHSDPVFNVDGVQHYCVANIPGAVPRTATLALTHATLPWVTALARQGQKALFEDASFAGGVNVVAGKLTHQAVAESLGLAFEPPQNILQN